MLNIRIFGAACILTAAAPFSAAAAQSWSGEGSLSAGLTTGNAETSDVGVAVKSQFETGVYTHHGELAFDYATADRIESKNRGYGAYQLDRRVGERLDLFVRTSYERDRFSGFESRVFAGAGLGYDVVDNGATTWSLKAAPGWRFDEIEPAPATATTPAVIGGREESFATVFGSAFKHEFNPAVSMSNDTEVIYAQVSTQTTNLAALTAKLNDKFSARFSLEARYESDPPPGRVNTNTTTRVGLVYGF